jgi:drug/metabolite transporter (DMT)-like permease
VSIVLKPTKRIDFPLRAISFYVGNLLIMVLISALVKHIAESYPVSQILLFRFAFAAIPLFLFAIATSGLASLKTHRYRDHAIRSGSGIFSISLLFFALDMIPIAEATMLAYSSPIFITILSIPILSERIGGWRWSAVILGFIGALVITQPGSAVFAMGSFVAIASAMTGAVVVIWNRLLSDTENAITTSVIYNTCGMIVFAIWIVLSGWVEIKNNIDWALLVLIGLAAAFQQFFFAVSFRYGEASLLAPFEYLILIFAVIIGYLIWGEVPAFTSIVGGVIIAASGLLIFSRRNLVRTTDKDEVPQLESGRDRLE